MPTLAAALSIFWWLGEPGDFDASAKMEMIRGSFGVSLLNFLMIPLVSILMTFAGIRILKR